MTLLEGYHWKYEVVSASYISPLCVLNNICVELAIHFSLVAKIFKNYLYLSKLAPQMVTSTPLENLSLLLYESQNKNFNFGTTKTLHARSIFFRGGHITNIWSKKIFFMKTLSKLEALTVANLIFRSFAQLYFGMVIFELATSLLIPCEVQTCTECRIQKCVSKLDPDTWLVWYFSAGGMTVIFLIFRNPSCGSRSCFFGIRNSGCTNNK